MGKKRSNTKSDQAVLPRIPDRQVINLLKAASGYYQKGKDRDAIRVACSAIQRITTQLPSPV